MGLSLGAGWVVRLCQTSIPLGSSRRLRHRIWIKSTDLALKTTEPVTRACPLPAQRATAAPAALRPHRLLGLSPICSGRTCLSCCTLYYELVALGQRPAQVEPAFLILVGTFPILVGAFPDPPKCALTFGGRWCGVVAKYTGSAVTQT